MAVAWPATLPAPIANSVKLHTQKNTRTIEFSAKNRRTTTRASKPPSIVECEISMDGVQLDAFDYFIKFDLSYGAHWIDASWLLPLGFSSHFARFLELPKITKRGGRFSVSCVFEIVLQYVAGQMPNITTYPTSNKQPGPSIPQMDLIATYDASVASVGDTYQDGTIMPDMYGQGFKSVMTNGGSWFGTPSPIDVVIYNNRKAARVNRIIATDGFSTYISEMRIQSQNAVTSSKPNVTVMIAVVGAAKTNYDQASLNGSIAGFYRYNVNTEVLMHIEDANRNNAATITNYVNGSQIYSLDYGANVTKAPFFGMSGGQYFVNSNCVYYHECMLWHGQNPMTAQQHADLVSYLMTKWLII